MRPRRPLRWLPRGRFLSSGSVLPGDYRTFLQQCARVSAMDIHNGYQLLSPSLTIRIRDQDDIPKTIGGAPALPVGADGGGNLFLLSLRPPHEVWKWNHETGAATNGTLPLAHTSLTSVAFRFRRLPGARLWRTGSISLQTTVSGHSWQAKGHTLETPARPEQQDAADEPRLGWRLAGDLGVIQASSTSQCRSRSGNRHYFHAPKGFVRGEAVLRLHRRRGAPVRVPEATSIMRHPLSPETHDDDALVPADTLYLVAVAVAETRPRPGQSCFRT